jgi:hypothetical protein
MAGINVGPGEENGLLATIPRRDYRQLGSGVSRCCCTAR